MRMRNILRAPPFGGILVINPNNVAEHILNTPHLDTALCIPPVQLKQTSGESHRWTLFEDIVLLVTAY